MAKSFLVDINLNKNELQNAIIQNLASDPSNPVAGQVYFNTTTNRFRVYTGTEWDEMGTGGGTVTSVSASNTDGSLSISGSPITTTGTIEIEHTNTVTAQTTQGLYPITYDANGHITGAGTAVDMSIYAPLASPALTGIPRDLNCCRRFLGYHKCIPEGSLYVTVKLFEEGDGLKASVIAKLVRYPFTGKLVIVKIEHGRHGVDPESIGVVVSEPEICA